MSEVIKNELIIWQAENGFVVRHGSCGKNWLAKDKHELVGLLLGFEYKNALPQPPISEDI